MYIVPGFCKIVKLCYCYNWVILSPKEILSNLNREPDHLTTGELQSLDTQEASTPMTEISRSTMSSYIPLDTPLCASCPMSWGVSVLWIWGRDLSLCHPPYWHLWGDSSIQWQVQSIGLIPALAAVRYLVAQMLRATAVASHPWTVRTVVSFVVAQSL